MGFIKIDKTTQRICQRTESRRSSVRFTPFLPLFSVFCIGYVIQLVLMLQWLKTQPNENRKKMKTPFHEVGKKKNEKEKRMNRKQTKYFKHLRSQREWARQNRW